MKSCRPEPERTAPWYISLEVIMRRHEPAGISGPFISLLLLTSLGAGCVIIVQPNVDADSAVAVPISCQSRPEVPTAHLLFSARVERSTANLAPYYDRFMQDTALGLAAAGIQTTRAVLLRADERSDGLTMLAAWGCGLDDPRALSPTDVIRHYATEDRRVDPQPGCALTPLVSLGEQLPFQVTIYPVPLAGTSGRSVFGEAPDLVVVIHIDAQARDAGWSEPACESAARLLSSADGRVAWLDYAGANPPIDRVVHWFAVTEEELERRGVCGALPRARKLSGRCPRPDRALTKAAVRTAGGRIGRHRRTDRPPVVVSNDGRPPRLSRAAGSGGRRYARARDRPRAHSRRFCQRTAESRFPG